MKYRRIRCVQRNKNPPLKVKNAKIMGKTNVLVGFTVHVYTVCPESSDPFYIVTT